MGVAHSPEAPLLLVNHHELLRYLGTDIDVQRSKVATRVEESDSKVTVTFEDGTSAVGDILVGADGIESVGRASSCILSRCDISLCAGPVLAN